MRDKGAGLRALADEAGVTLAQVAYVGNDANDLPALLRAGLAVAVADARPEVRAVAHLVLSRPGGHGAVREICDLLVARRRQAFEEERHRHVEHLRDLEQPPRGDAVQASLVLVCLLVGYADHAGELLLRQAHHDPALADAGADVAVRRVGALPRLGARLLGRRSLCPAFTLLCGCHTQAFQP